MADLKRGQRLHCGTVQIFIDQCDLIRYNPVVDRRHDVRELISGCESYRFFLDISVRDHAAYDLISQDIIRINVLRTQRNIYPVRRIRIQNRRRIVSDCLYFTFRTKDTSVSGCPVYSGVIIHIIDRSCLFRELLRILHRILIRSLSPSFEEFQDILLRRSAGQTHQLLI